MNAGREKTTEKGIVSWINIKKSLLLERKGGQNKREWSGQVREGVGVASEKKKKKNRTKDADRERNCKWIDVKRCKARRGERQELEETKEGRNAGECSRAAPTKSKSVLWAGGGTRCIELMEGGNARLMTRTKGDAAVCRKNKLQLNSRPSESQIPEWKALCLKFRKNRTVWRGC